jgi:hypothetical protein
MLVYLDLLHQKLLLFGVLNRRPNKQVTSIPQVNDANYYFMRRRNPQNNKLDNNQKFHVDL